MLLVFVLVVSVNGEIDKTQSYWKDLTRCRYFAQQLTWQSSNIRYGNPVRAWCKPAYVDPKRVQIHT